MGKDEREVVKARDEKYFYHQDQHEKFNKHFLALQEEIENNIRS